MRLQSGSMGPGTTTEIQIDLIEPDQNPESPASCQSRPNYQGAPRPDLPQRSSHSATIRADLRFTTRQPSFSARTPHTTGTTDSNTANPIDAVLPPQSFPLNRASVKGSIRPRLRIDAEAIQHASDTWDQTPELQYCEKIEHRKTMIRQGNRLKIENRTSRGIAENAATPETPGEIEANSASPVDHPRPLRRCPAQASEAVSQPIMERAARTGFPSGRSSRCTRMKAGPLGSSGMRI